MSRPLPEPWRVKVVEKIKLLSREERERLLVEGGFSLFQIPSEAVFIDLFSRMSDSGVPVSRFRSSPVAGASTAASGESTIGVRVPSISVAMSSEP